MKEASKATAFGGATKPFVAYDTTRDFLRQKALILTFVYILKERCLVDQTVPSH